MAGDCVLASRTFFSAVVVVAVSTLMSSTDGLRFLGQPETYARYPKWNACPNASLSFEFRTSQPTALLLYTDDNGRYDYLQLALTKGSVRLWINFVAEENRYVDIEANTEPLNDGRWHQVEIRRNRMETVLLVDGTQTSKVALGSDFEFGRDPAQNNYVYFGGVPSSYANNLRGLALPSAFFSEKFRGDVRNILYFNCSCIPVRASLVEGQGVTSDPQEACEVRNPCPKDCPCISADDGPGCGCTYKRECLKDTLAMYHLPMDEIKDQTVLNPSGLDSVVEGGVQLARGVRRNALAIDGRSQWLRVTGAAHRLECMGDLARCDRGYYLAMWLQFRGAGYQRGVYLSNGGHSSDSHGVAFFYSKGKLEVVFKMADGREWRVRGNGVLEDRWYHVAVTWSQQEGLHLYVNGRRVHRIKTPTKRQAVTESSRFNGFYVGRANDNTGTERLGQLLVDDFVFVSAFKDDNEVKESGAVYHYYLPLDEVQQDHVTDEGLTVRVYGPISKGSGKVASALSFPGTRSYVDLGDVAGTCIGDLDLCEYGLYVSFWVSFSRLDSGPATVLSAPSIRLYQDGGQLVANARKSSEFWETRFQGLQPRAWYFVELSWGPNDGLQLYVNRGQQGHQVSGAYRPPETRPTTHMYMGRDDPEGRRYPTALVDEVDIYYGDRDTLLNIDFIERGRPTNMHFTMDTVIDGRLVHDSMAVNLLGRPALVEGMVGRGLQLDGQDDVLDFGVQGRSCFGNLDMCPHGMTLALWLKPERLQDRSYFLSTGNNGLSMSYTDKKLQVTAATTTNTWSVSTADFPADRWHFLEVSFHPEKGLRLYDSGRLVAESPLSDVRNVSAPASQQLDRFYVGRGNVDMTRNRYAPGVFDELDVWYADRDYLTSHGFLQRSRPENIVVHFEESPDRTRITHPTLDIRLIGRPELVPGKIGNALELRGRGQYADLGMLDSTCMGNLARCTQGITLSAWMKFRSFENDMVFLSTGQNGLLMLYRDGYIHVSADGRGLVTAPRFQADRWYHVEISWHPNYGLRLYVDNQLVAESPRIPIEDSGQPGEGHFYIGRPNDGAMPGNRYTTGNFDIDELEVWYGRREDLLAFNYISRDEPGYEAFSMDSALGNRLDHSKYVVLLENGARLGPGHVGQAVVLDGRGQYVDLGEHVNSCLGNLDLCPHGFTMSLWLKPGELRDNTHYLAAPSYALFYEDGELKAEFGSEGRVWTVATPNFRSGEWQRVTLSWHAKKGLSLFVNDELMDASSGQDRAQADQPASDHVYLGRNLADARLTADVQADELQVWYDYVDQLRATGKYEVQIVPRLMSFDNWNNGQLVLRDRTIYAIGELVLVPGLGQGSTAVYLDGRTKYIDLGSNFTCNGNLDTCRQGATIRLALKPNQLVDGAYFLDSFPVKVYYKDGRIYAEMQTPTRVWQVNSADIQPGQWARLELTWHPTNGLTLYVNGQRAGYQTFPRERAPVTNIDWRSYLGRPLNEAEGTYADVLVDNMEFYNAYHNYVPSDSYLQLIRDQERPQEATTERSAIIGEPGRVTTQRPPLIQYTQTAHTATIIRLDGASYVSFNFAHLPAEYLTYTTEEKFSLWFLTDQSEGLLWYHQEPRRNLYLAMKDGHLVFVNDNKSALPEEVHIGRRDGKRFNDFKWHNLTIHRNGRRIRMTVDDGYQEEYIFSENVQFLVPAVVWLGGTDNTVDKTKGNIRQNFRGGVARVVYVTHQRQGDRITSNEVNLITHLSSGSPHGQPEIQTIPNIFEPGYPSSEPIFFSTRPPPTIPTRPPPPQITAVTFIGRGVSHPISSFNLRDGYSITFKFQTINQNGLLLYAGVPRGDFLAVELVDGRLYFVHNFGRRDKRTAFASRIMADGQQHEVEMRFYSKSHVDLRVDDIRERLNFEVGEQLPTNIGPLYVGGYLNYNQLPWMVWSRESYLGCLEYLQLDGRVVDFSELVRGHFGEVRQQCSAMPQECTSKRPCVNGVCRNAWGEYFCDCRDMAYRGPNCQLGAWTALFNGSIWGKLDYSHPVRTHVDNMSIRFKSPLENGLLFQTSSRDSNVYLRCSLENGRVKVETNLGGEVRTFYAGQNLNDLNWHTLFIQRRGNEMEVWVDDKDHSKQTLAGEGYFFSLDHVDIAGVDPDGGKNSYIGYLQNFYLNDLDILDRLRGSILRVDIIDRLPPLLYHAVTFPQFDTFIHLPPLRLANITVLHFMFKTKEYSGILLLAVGKQTDHLVVELFDGKMEILVNGIKIKLQQRLNDGSWHAVTIQRAGIDQRQFLLTVDGVTSSFVYPGQDALFLDEALYIGGAPQNVLQRDYIKKSVSSRSGFRGCLASVDLSGQVPDLTKFASDQGVTLHNTCQDVGESVCTQVSCENFGICITTPSGAFSCDCTMTAHAGIFCTEHPFGFHFQNFSRGDGGLFIYTYRQPSTSEKDEIAFGVMTRQKDATLIRLFSETFSDFITFRLVDGRIVAEYDTNAEGGSQTVIGERVDDGNYHIIRFMRGPDRANLYVDSLSAVISSHTSKHGSFDGLNKIYIGGSGYQNNLIQNGFDGIIGGLTVNGFDVFGVPIDGRDIQLIQNVRFADRPFSLEESTIVTIPTPSTSTFQPTVVPPPIGPEILVIPPDVGGGGVGWVPGPGGIGAEVYPGGHGGTGLVVPGPYIPVNDPLVGAQVAAPPPLPASGPRAGAVMGTILGLLALASSMMWAFYRCKPGWCTCLKPYAAPSLNISSPRASGTNKPLLSAVGGGSGAGGGGVSSSSAAGAGGAGGAGAGGAGAGGSFSNFYLSQTSASAAGGGGAGTGGGESYDTATLRATGTFSNKGTVIGTPKPARAHLGSTASGVSGGGYSSTYTSHVRSASETATDGPGLTPASIQSYHYEGGGGSGTADYDLVTGVSSNYQSNTLTAGERSLGGSSVGYSGGVGGPAGYSTMSSSYNYSVKTVRTVSGQQQMVGYAGASHIGVPPGALGEEVRVDCCLMTNDGHSVVTGSSLGPPQVWDMQTGELLRIMRGETVGSTNLHLACNDRLLVGAINADLEVNQSSIPKGVHNYLLQIWDFSSGQALEMADLEVCSALAMMSDNDKVVFARSDKFGGGTNVVVWDLLGNQPIKHMRFDAPIGNNDYVHFLALSQNDRYVVAGFTNSFDNFSEFVVFDMTLTSYTVSDPSILRLDANPECTAVLPRDEAVTGLRNGDLVIWSLRTGQPSRQLLSGSGRHAHSREIKAVARSEDNKYLVSASADGTLKVWDIETERHINTLNGHTDEVWCCAISPDNEIVVSGSRDRTIRLWRLKSGTEICSFNAGVDIFHVTMSRDKSVIVALGDKMGARKLIMLQVVRTKVRRQISS